MSKESEVPGEITEADLAIARMATDMAIASVGEQNPDIYTMKAHFDDAFGHLCKILGKSNRTTMDETSAGS
ncbi:MAG: hypothetical protein BECKG1743D_GA0114223_104312 [Candidatus Kentron sp. G]|nr:MAG: hypothetical protein BECKG1743F_GA0114225_104092 [Candidatus Kentron sp. G]VFN01010.1 MAG: hypothetical protein BECKG1743E_GA0114224_103713 [Candidatus Kentron sp. G]VFN03103.1 MAG: hypothetical protein BECKG1743D_GA0114223_104312 [Candidatus Kentron sp. G]